MYWTLKDVHTGDTISQFDDPELAENFRTRMGPVLAERYYVSAVQESGDNPELVRILTEGLVRGDLRDILLPRLSIDEYVSADPESDNVVISFFLKGVPEAVLPLKNFCEHCEGVSLADYANSETIENCTIVYVEMDRPTIKVENIVDMLEQVCVIADMNPEDFTLTFPNTTKKYPYDPDVMERYFQYRTEEKSKQAQEDAIQQSEEEAQEENQQGVRESMVNRMVSLFDLSDHIGKPIF